jgi:ribosomal protein L22
MRKLKEVCAQVSGLKVTEAIRQLEVNNRRVSGEILKCVKMAQANAKNQAIPSENLIVSNLIIGRGKPLKRFEIKAKGRIGELHHPRSNLTVFVRPLEYMKGKSVAYKRTKLEIRQKYKAWRNGQVYPQPKVEKIETKNE